MSPSSASCRIGVNGVARTDDAAPEVGGSPVHLDLEALSVLLGTL